MLTKTAHSSGASVLVLVTCDVFMQAAMLTNLLLDAIRRAALPRRVAALVQLIPPRGGERLKQKGPRTHLECTRVLAPP